MSNPRHEQRRGMAELAEVCHVERNVPPTP